MKVKTCSACLESKHEDAFHKNRRMKDGLHNQCKDCRNRAAAQRPTDHPTRIAERERLRERPHDHPSRVKERERARKWNRTNPERAARRRRDGKLRRQYGVDAFTVERILMEQGGVCAVCRTGNWTSCGPVVDHDHASGAVRGVLCNKCNTGLGFLRESPDIMANAMAYISKAPAQVKPVERETPRSAASRLGWVTRRRFTPTQG